MSTTIDNECSVANGCKPQETASVTPIVYVNHIPKRRLSQSFEFAKRKDEGNKIEEQDEGNEIEEQDEGNEIEEQNEGNGTVEQNGKGGNNKKDKSNEKGKGKSDGDGDGNDSDSDNEDDDDDDDKVTERGNKNSSSKGTNDYKGTNFRINLAVNNNSTTTSKDFGNSNSNGNIKGERKGGRNSSNEVEDDGETEDDENASSKEPTDNEKKNSNRFTNFQVNYAADNNSRNANSDNKNSFDIKKEDTNKNTDEEVNDNNGQDGTTPVTTEGPFTGTGIPYSPAEGTCSNQSYSDDDLVVALNKQQYGDDDVSEFCGKCIEVTGDSAKMVFTIVSVCDDCEYGGIEIAQNVYSQLISDENSGDITWDFVDC
ncbi:hypothetical protein H4R99_000560 [Coemansia sp. RSA 1722]|nr:hypothetical protein H4R99_000560 [Coemansia sp. RSA 1722]